MAEKFDFVFVGAGHNGLTAACYLAKAGQKVACFERRENLGGGCCTEEKIRGNYVTLPGFQHNLHSVVHTFIHAGPVMKDLELEKHGIEYIYPESPATALFLNDKRSLVFHTDIERTMKEVEQFSKRDAEGYRALQAQFAPMVKLVYGSFFNPPMGQGAQIAAMEQTEEGLQVIKVINSTQEHIVNEFFESEQVKVAFLALAESNATPSDMYGGGIAIPYLCCLMHVRLFSLAKGGARQITEAMARVLEMNKGKVVKDCAVTRIIVEKGKAKGVELANGETVLADKAVVSNTCPQETLLDLVGKEHLEPSFLPKVKGIKPDMLVPFVTVQALNKPPNWKAAEEKPQITNSFLVFTLCDTVREFMASTHDCAEGELPLRHLRMVTPAHSNLDPSLVPEGKASSGHMVMVPPVLKEGFEHWDAVKEEVSTKMLEHVAKFAPNMAPGSPNILANAIRSPLDVARENTSMFLGSWVGGSQAIDQMGLLRPYPSLRPYRTPVEKLYMCGMHNHPVGGVSGASGYNAANVICEDYKIKKWWKPYAPEI